MIYLKIKVKQYQVTEFANVITYFIKSNDILQADQYFHFFNLKSLFKRLLDKQFNFQPIPSKITTIKININEFETVKFMYSLLSEEFKTEKMNYYDILLTEILGNLDKQSKNLNSFNFFLN